MAMPNQTNKLAGQMPIADEAAAQSAESVNQLNLQQQMSAAGTQGATAGPAAAQQMGAALAQKQGAVKTQLAQSNASSIVNLAKGNLKEQQISRTKRNNEHTVRIEQQRTEQETKFKALGRDVDRQLIQSRREFEEGARGDRFTSERQLQDFMVQQQMDDQAFETYKQDYMQAMDRDINEMENAAQVFMDEAERMFKSGEAAKDRASYDRLIAYKEHLDRQAAAAKRKKSRQGKIIGAVKVVAAVAITVATNGAAAPAVAGMAAEGAGEMTS